MGSEDLTVRILGLDPAWSTTHPERRRSAGVCFDAQTMELLAATLVGTRDELAAWARSWCEQGPAWIAIDAPLHIPNLSGSRPCEITLRKLGLAIYSASSDGLRERYRAAPVGPALAEALAPLPVLPQPDATSARGGLVEVYPYAALECWWPARPRYKSRRPGSTAVMDGVKEMLAALLRQPELATGRDSWAPRWPAELRGLIGQGPPPPTRLWLGRAGDLIDALVAALVVWRTWASSASVLVGDAATGSVLLPNTVYLEARLARISSGWTRLHDPARLQPMWGDH